MFTETKSKRLTTKELEIQVALAQIGYIPAQQAVVESLYGLVAWTIKPYIKSWDARDLFQVAIIGIYDAIKRYARDNDGDMTFSKYAYWRMRRKIEYYIFKQNNITQNVFYEHEMDEEVGMIIAEGWKYSMDLDTFSIAIHVNKAIAQLPERERYIVIERMRNGKTLSKLGKELGITTTRVDQLWRRALNQLKPMLKELI